MNPAAGDLFSVGLGWSVVGSLWAWLLALGLGASILPSRWMGDAAEDRDASSRLLTWAVVGFVIQTQVWLALSTLGLLHPPVVLGTAGGLTAVALWAGRRRVLTAARIALTWKRPGSTVDQALLLTSVALGGIFLAVVARFAVWPTIFYDDLVYHVGAPRQALLTGSWPAMPGMHYTFMPAGWDAAYLLPLALGGGVGPQLMNTICLALLCLAVYRLARLGGSAGAAAAATTLLLLTPMMLGLGAFAGNDLYVGLALVMATERLVAGRGSHPAIVGLLCGAAWGTKYTALAACAGIGLAAALGWRVPARERLRRLAIVGLVAMAVPIAWTLRTFLLTGNPIYPAFHSILGGSYWDAQSAAVVGSTISHGGIENRGPAAFGLALVDLLLRSESLGYPSGTSPWFVALGLGGILLLRRVRGAPALLVVAAVSYAGWCVTSLNLRYALLLLAVLAPFATAVLTRGVEALERATRLPLVARVLLPGLLVAAVAAPSGAAVRRHLEQHGPGTTFLGDVPREDMQVSRLHLAAAGRAMARELPPGARILLVAEGRIGCLPRPALASSAYDRPDIARFVAGAREVDEINRRLSGFTHVVVNYREKQRFEEQFGFVERFGPGEWELFERWLQEGLEPVARFGVIVVYRIPARAGP